MTDSSIYPIECSFPNPDPLTNPTYDWDAVYAVKYSVLNRALAADAVPAPPWKQNGAIDLRGNSNAGQLSSAIVSNVQLARGGSGQLLTWRLRVDALGYQSLIGLPIAGAFSFDVTVRTTLVFQPDPQQDDLVHLHVATQPQQAAPGTVVQEVVLDAATLTGVTYDADQIDTIEDDIALILKNTLQSHMPALFDATPLSSVLTQELAKEANAPWLLPRHYDYATADLPGSTTDGVLAVLVSTTSSQPSAVVSAQAFPTNTGVDAAVILKSDVVSRGPFLAQLNKVAGDNTTFGVFAAVEHEPGAVANKDPISLHYRIDSDTGTMLLIPTADLANSHGETFPARIAPGMMKIRVADKAITVDVAEIKIEMDSVTLVLSIRTGYRLAVNSQTRGIDLTPDGSPAITSHYETVDDASGTSILQVAGILAGIVLSELGVLAVERLSSFYTNTTGKRMRQYQSDVMAGLRQSEIEGRPVEVDVGQGRYVVIERRSEKPAIAGEPDTGVHTRPAAIPERLKQEYRNSLKLSPAYPEAPAPTAARNVELGHLDGAGNTTLNTTNENVGLLTRHREQAAPRHVTTGAGPLHDIRIRDARGANVGAQHYANEAHIEPRRKIKRPHLFQYVQGPQENARPPSRQGLRPQPDVRLQLGNNPARQMTEHLPNQGANAWDHFQRANDHRAIQNARPRVPNTQAEVVRNAAPRPLSRRQALARGPVALKTAWMVADVLHMIRFDPALRGELINEIKTQINKGTGRATSSLDAHHIQNVLAGAAAGRDAGNVLHEKLTSFPGHADLRNSHRDFYTATVQCLEKWYGSGKITATQYMLIAQHYEQFTQAQPPLVSYHAERDGGEDIGERPQGSPHKQRQPDFMNRSENDRTHIYIETRAVGRDTVQVAPLLLAELERAERTTILQRDADPNGPIRGAAGDSALIIEKIIGNAKLSLARHGLGIAAYIAGIAAGTLAGNWAGNAINAAARKGENEQKAEDAQKSTAVLNAITKKPSQLLFGAVTFPLMERYEIGGVPDTSAPAPADVLQCASVNGALVIGVSIP